MQYVEIKNKEYPILYSVQALMWYADWLGIPLKDLNLDEGEMTERKLCALLYSGLIAGSEQSQKRLDISFSGFQEILLENENDLAGTLGTHFRRQMEVNMGKYAEKSDELTPKNSKKKASTR